MPFDTMEEALDWAAGVEQDGFECFMYYSGDKPTNTAEKE